MRHRGCIIPVLLVSTLVGVSHASNLVTNGDFEEPQIPGPFVEFFAQIPGWRATIRGAAFEMQKEFGVTQARASYPNNRFGIIYKDQPPLLWFRGGYFYWPNRQ
jgi:hypothetical protein